MAAATAYTASYNAENFGRLLRKSTAVRKNPNLNPAGIYAFDTLAQTVASTNVDDVGDELFSISFPNDCYLVALQAASTDMDTGGPTLLIDVIVEDAAGTETVLIESGTNLGQSTVSDELDLGTSLFLLDVSNKKLGFKVEAAATTPAAGTIRYKGLVYVGPLVTNF